ncbi:MAG: aminopeptidase [Polyangiaceae bacterium]
MPTLHAASSDLLQNKDLSATPHDALVVIAHAPLADRAAELGPVAAAAIEALSAADATFARGSKAPLLLPWPSAPGGRVVVSALPSLADDTDDVRALAEATNAAVSRAVDAGARRPLLVVTHPSTPRFAKAREVTALAALASQWAPLEAREAHKAKPAAEAITVVGLDDAAAKRLAAIEVGRCLARDIAGTEPERMAPRKAAAACVESFAGTGVTVNVTREVNEYPLLAAVARASLVVERHRPCVVELRYRPSGPITRTLILAGKGVTYDTGGADLKTDGSMAGMSRDKGGAAAVAGAVRAAAELALPGVEVIGLLGFVRNSIGEEAFVSDEIIPSRAGVRVRIGNTDAEGRLVLADLLARAKEIAKDAPSPVLMSVATLTGHVYRAFGPYVGAIGNSAAREAGVITSLETHGETWGEPMESTRPRREDYAMVAPKSPCEDVLSSNRLASVATPRGHQFPFAFLDIASGLRGEPIPFVHLDIAGAAYSPVDWQTGTPTAAPVLSLIAYLTNH